MGAWLLCISVSLGFLSVMSISSWISLAWRVSSVMPASELTVRLDKLERTVADTHALLKLFLERDKESKARKGVAKRVLQRGNLKPSAGQVTLRVAMSTMRRGLDKEHVYDTLDSLMPYLGSHGRLHVSVTVVDVERGDGSFAEELRNKYKELTAAGLMEVEHMDDASRAQLYDGLQETCAMHRLYGDDLARTLWRSKRVLDFVVSVRLAAAGGADLVLVLEDDTPAVGDLAAGVVECIDRYANTSTACRWDFHWDHKTALAKTVGLDKPEAKRPAKIMYPQGNLQGLFAMALPSADWIQMCDYMRLHFDKAPADWLVGRWLFQQNWRIAFMPPVLSFYHAAGSNFASSSRLTLARQLGDDPIFKDRPLSWDKCPPTPVPGQPFKWEDPSLFHLRWVGGQDFFLEVPWTDLEGHDLGIPRDAALMDQDARLIVCEMTPECQAVNAAGWMKRELLPDALSPPAKTKRLFLRVPADASPAQLDHIKTFFLECVRRMPGGRLPKEKR